jgi:hypothetical protein
VSEIQGTIQENILTVMRDCVYGYMKKYRSRPKALALGPEEYINWENACRSTFQMIYDPLGDDDKSMFEGIEIFVAPINGVMPMGGRKALYEIIEVKRGLLQGLN